MGELYSITFGESLSHHGIKGQKWGVRRYQNYDGTRIKDNLSVVKAEQDIYKKMSNKAEKLNKQNIDLKNVMSRGSLTEQEASECIKLGNKVYEKAETVEPYITSDILSCINNVDAMMYGLEYRLKQPTSIAAKIGSDAKEKNISFEDASQIKDAVRYTAISENDSFASNYSRIKSGLEEMGYKETKCKNYYDSYRNGKSMHKSVQSTFANPDGYEFELQFQTPSSQAAKELKIPIYNERRQAGNSETRNKELERQMRVLADQVPNPKDIYKILSH